MRRRTSVCGAQVPGGYGPRAKDGRVIVTGIMYGRVQRIDVWGQRSSQRP